MVRGDETAEHQRRVLVIGAQGSLGATTVSAFAAAGWLTRPAGRRPDPRPEFRALDLDHPETFARAFADVDVAVSAVPHPAMAAERHVLRSGGLLLNMSDFPAERVQALRASAEVAVGCVVVNAGLVPGLTNLVAAELVERHPDADEIQTAFTVAAGATAGKAAGVWAHRTLTTKRRHRTIDVPWPAPFRRQGALEYGEGERGGLDEVAGDRRVGSFISFDERPLHAGLMAINRLGAMRALPRAAFMVGRSGQVAEATTEPVALWVAVLRGGRLLGSATMTCSGDYRTTAACASLFADVLLARGATSASPGVHYPEQLLALADVSERLPGIGLSLRWDPDSG